jgi:DNA-binding transcriptional MerR regulator
LLTLEKTLDTLKRFDIDETDIAMWEAALGLSVPSDDYGRKQYSPHHVNLFKNIKKHMTLGRSLEQIKDLIQLPPASEARPTQGIAPRIGRTLPGVVGTPAASSNRYASPPLTPNLTANSIDATTPLSTNQPAPSASISTQAVQTSTQSLNIARTIPAASDASMSQLLDRLISEKEQLQHKITETEKLNSHLYNANTMFHGKVKQLNEEIATLQDKIAELRKVNKEDNHLRVMEIKDRLQKQLIEAEKNLSERNIQVATLKQSVQSKEHEVTALKDLLAEKDAVHQQLIETRATAQYKDQEILSLKASLTECQTELRQAEAIQQAIKAERDQAQQQITQLQGVVQQTKDEIAQTQATADAQQKSAGQEHERLEFQIKALQRQIKNMTTDFQPSQFCGTWVESSTLLEIAYDNFGINIEPQRTRQFKINEPPTNVFGCTAAIQTQYEYESNALWRRNEMMLLTHMQGDTLQGLLICEFVLDGVPVARAQYRVTCQRHGT